MIFRFASEFVHTLSAQKLADLCAMMVRKQHYIVCDNSTYQLMVDAVDAHGSTTDKELFRKYKGFQPSQEIAKYLRTVDLDKNTDLDLETVINSKSEVIMENGAYEWPFYSMLADVYKHDRRFGNVFKKVFDAIKGHRLVAAHAGGWSSFAQLAIHKNANDYKGVYPLKAMMIFDRDTDDAHSFDGNKNGLFSFLCGKKADQLTEADVYALSQSPYVWHVWYKRAIENYFPNWCYERKGVDMTSVPTDVEERDYYDFGQLKHYSKKDMKELPQGMSKSDYEEGLKHFRVDGIDVSEFQLLLLKMAKII